MRSRARLSAGRRNSAFSVIHVTRMPLQDSRSIRAWPPTTGPTTTCCPGHRWDFAMDSVDLLSAFQMFAGLSPDELRPVAGTDRRGDRGRRRHHIDMVAHVQAGYPCAPRRDDSELITLA